MKKISILSMISALVLPAFAEEAKVETPAPVKDAVVEEVAPVVETPATEIVEPLTIAKEETRNPKTKFPRGLQAGVGISALSGVNGFIGYNNKNFDSFWAKRFGVRVDLSSFSPIKKDLNKEINDTIKDDGPIKIADVEMDNFKVDGHQYGVLVDFYPFGDTWLFGGWRVSGGYFTGKLDLKADIADKSIGGIYTFELDGHEYSYDAGTMKGKAKVNWKYSGPYIGTGFDLGLFWGFKVYVDAGVVFADKSAKAGLDVPLDGLKDGDALVSSDAGLKTAFEERKAAELKDVQNKLDDYPYYPIVKLGLMYRF